MTCTWEGCSAPAEHDVTARDGEVWARLCPAHHAELMTALERPEPGVALKAWIAAQGGTEKTVERMMRRF